MLFGHAQAGADMQCSVGVSSVAVMDLPGTMWAGKSCAGSWFPHAQAPDPASAERAGRSAPWLDPSGDAALYQPLVMQCHTETPLIHHQTKTC